MKATEGNLATFLAQPKTQFVIPVYQRNYDWTEAQCSQLFSDIVAVGERPGDTHFIGSIVYIYEGIYTSSEVKQLVVIDGQQRLTTLSVLLLAMYHFALRNQLQEKAKEIEETHLLNRFVKQEDSKLKLKQSDINARAFKYIMAGNKLAEYQEFSRVIENYDFFFSNITSDNFAIVEAGLQRLLFVEISLERGKDDPQRIFESLNSTGLELSQADLIRNYILMGLKPDEQARLFSNYWEVIESYARDEQKEESRVSDFIRDFLTFKTKKIPNKNKVYEEFKKRHPLDDAEFYTTILPQLKEYSFYYNKLINYGREPEPLIKKELDHIQRLEINICYPFLLPVYNDYQNGVLTKDDFVQVLRVIQSFVWRRFILGLATNSLNKIFMTLYNEVEKADYVASIERALCRKKGNLRFPTDKEIEVALVEKDMYNIQSKNRTYFLELLENHNNREFVSVSNPNITIEHIFPQTPDQKWYSDLDELSFKAMEEKYLHTIANLTLSGNNGSLSNRSFGEKQAMNFNGGEQGYKFSRLWLNQYLREIPAWNLETLRRRYEIIFDRFCQIWQYPDVEVDDEFDTDQDYTIYDAPDPTFRKLDYFIFKDEKVSTNEMSKMYYHVLKSLFTENPSAFYHQGVKELLELSNDQNSLRSAVQLGPNYYYESNIDNRRKFARLKALLESFGYEEELLINYSEAEPGEDEEESIGREYWVKKRNPEVVSLIEECEGLLKSKDPEIRLHFMKSYVGLSKDSRPQNFAIFVPKRNFLRVIVASGDPDKWVEVLKSRNLKSVAKGKWRSRVRFRLSHEDFAREKKIIEKLLFDAYDVWMEK